MFGLIGSGNFAVTNALVAGGMSFVAARHEGGAISITFAGAERELWRDLDGDRLAEAIFLNTKDIEKGEVSIRKLRPRAK